MFYIKEFLHNMGVNVYGGLANGSPLTARALMAATGAKPMDMADEVVAKWIQSIETRLAQLEQPAPLPQWWGD